MLHRPSFSLDKDKVKISTCCDTMDIKGRAYINHKLWILKNKNLARKKFIILYAKSFLYIIVKLEKVLKTLWIHLKKKTKQNHQCVRWF